jgi:hypothetical protein
MSGAEIIEFFIHILLVLVGAKTVQVGMSAGNDGQDSGNVEHTSHQESDVVVEDITEVRSFPINYMAVQSKIK